MKKVILKACTLAALSLSISNISNAQWMPHPTAVNTIETDPALLIDDIRFSTNSSQMAPIRSLRGETDNGYLEIYSNHHGDNGASLFMYSNNLDINAYPWATPGQITFWSSQGASDYNMETSFELLHNEPGIGHTSLFTIDKDGDITLKNNTLSPNYNAIKGNSGVSGMVLYGDKAWSDGGGIMLNGQNNAGGPGAVSFVTTNSTAPNGNEAGFVYWGNAFSNKLMQINKSGNVGIGIDPNTDPGQAYRLRIKGNIQLHDPYGNPSDDRGIIGDTRDGRLTLLSGTDAGNGSCILMHGDTRSANDGRGQITFIANADKQDDENEKAFEFVTFDGGYGTSGATWTNRVCIKNNGKVVIGHNIIYNDPGPYKLYVQEGILTEKIKVALSSDQTNWPDFVFDDDYNLLSLNEVEDYIKENKHLPAIPSTEEVHANGLDLAQMDAKLLQKIEELTLYVIQQQKEINELKSKLNK